ncbi:MAG: glycosyltransferase family 39 protein [Candidatus Omnitrophota bacterium]
MRTDSSSMPDRKKEVKKLLLLVFLLAVALRLFTAIYYLNFDPHAQSVLDGKPFLGAGYSTDEIIGDRDRYNNLAQSVSYYGTLAPVAGSETHPPLYPLFLSVFYMLFGYHVYSFLIPQILLDSLNSILIFFLAQYLFVNRKISFISAFFYACNPHFILTSIQLYSEALYFFLIIAVFLSFKELFLKYSMKNVVICGVFLSLAALCRTIFLAFIPFALAWFVYAFRFLKKKMLAGLAVLCATIAFLFMPWLIRNYALFSKPVFSSDYSIVLAKSISLSDPDQAGRYLVNNRAPVSHFIRWALERPSRYLSATKKRFSTFFFDAYPQGVSGRHQFIANIIFYLIFPLGYIGLLVEVWRRQKLPLLIFLFIASTVFVHILTDIDGELRYRLPTEIFLGIFAWYGIMFLSYILRKEK